MWSSKARESSLQKRKVRALLRTQAEKQRYSDGQVRAGKTKRMLKAILERLCEVGRIKKTGMERLAEDEKKLKEG